MNTKNHENVDLLIRKTRRDEKSFFRRYLEDGNPNLQILPLNLDSIS